MNRSLAYLVLASLSFGAAATVVGEDRRGAYSLKADQAPFLFKPAEVARLRNVIGYVFCPGALDLKNGSGSTGFLIRIADQTYVVTAAHTFVDGAGRTREPLSSCSFTSFGLRSEKIPLVFRTRGGSSYLFATLDWKVDPINDVAVVRLSRPSPDAEPFSLEDFTGSLQGLDQTRLFAISALQRDFSVGSDLILQNCASRKFFPPTSTRSSAAYTDCAGKKGASGSPLFARVDGILRPVGLIQASKDGPDGLPYDEATSNYTLVIGLDLYFLKMLAGAFGVSN